MRIRSLLAALAAATLAAAPAAAQQRPDMNAVSADRAAIEQAARDYEAAWAKGDATAIAVMYSKDLLSIGNAGITNGREDLQRDFSENFAGEWKGTTIKINREPVEFIRPDVALAYGTYVVKRGESTIADGRYLSVWVKENGKWHIRANQALVPAKPATAGGSE